MSLRLTSPGLREGGPAAYGSTEDRRTLRRDHPFSSLEGSHTHYCYHYCYYFYGSQALRYLNDGRLAGRKKKLGARGWLRFLPEPRRLCEIILIGRGNLI